VTERELAEAEHDGAERGPAQPPWVELDSADAPPHDHRCGDGSHAAAVSSIEGARRSGRAICVRTVVTRSNVHGLATLASWLAEQEVAAWSLELVRTADVELARRLLPSLGLSAPRVLHALASARGRGVEPFLVGFPLCVLGPYARWSVPLEVGEWAHAAPCDACPARPTCPGLGPSHRERFGVRELRRLPAPVGPERSPRRDFLAPASPTAKTIVD